MTQIRAALDRLTAAIVATGAGQPRGAQLLPTTYRGPLDLAPAGGAHRRFECLVSAGRAGRDMFGSGDACYNLDLAVRVAYSRLGGDAGGGDRKSVNVAAGSDATLIVDTLTDMRNWSPSTTGIREVSFVPGSSAMVSDGAQLVVWETRLLLELQVAAPL